MRTRSTSPPDVMGKRLLDCGDLKSRIGDTDRALEGGGESEKIVRASEGREKQEHELARRARRARKIKTKQDCGMKTRRGISRSETRRVCRLRAWS